VDSDLVGRLTLRALLAHEGSQPVLFGPGEAVGDGHLVGAVALRARIPLRAFEGGEPLGLGAHESFGDRHLVGGQPFRSGGALLALRSGSALRSDEGGQPLGLGAREAFRDGRLVGGLTLRARNALRAGGTLRALLTRGSFRTGAADEGVEPFLLRADES